MYRSHRERPSRGLFGSLVSSLILVALLPATLVAQEVTDPPPAQQPNPVLARPDYSGASGLHVEAIGGIFFPQNISFGENEVGFTLDDARPLYGGRVGYTFASQIFIEGSYSYTPLAYSPEGGGLVNLNTFMINAAVGYSYPLLPRRIEAFGLGGLGLIQWLPNGSFTRESLDVLLGVGMRFRLTPLWSLRLDLRDHFVPSTLTGFREELNPDLQIDGDATHNLELSLSASFTMPVDADSDGDNVFNRFDQCPDTPGWMTADARGCPLDADEDGVPNFRDRCPLTTVKSQVGPDGCSLDEDADGVIDPRDRCPGTGVGMPVDESGCALDGDNDGVPDGRDQCHGSPVGAVVDEVGCLADSDGDGLQDSVDECPNTPSGQRVNENGCSQIEAGLEQGRLILSTIDFATGRAQLLGDSRDLLYEVGRALVARPGIRIEIQGHTDATGAPLTNLSLSEDRAEAVLRYLLGRFPELNASQFVVRGWGEGRPIATNRTAEGRARNRRIEFVVLSR